MSAQETRVSVGTVFSSPVHWLAFGFGSGLVPVAPGTFGTLAAVPLYLLCSDLSLVEFIGMTAVLFAVGVWLCGRSSSALGVHDHPGIVWDEIVGYFVTMIAVPPQWYWILTGFVLFRFFDIVKPWPIRWLDRHVEGGFGIMADDLLAGLFALAIMHLLLWFY